MPLILGVVLGNLIESSYVQTAIMYDGGFSWLIDRPVPLVLAIVCVLIIAFKVIFRNRVALPTDIIEGVEPEE
jgi:TctA family transporter